mmetsp:Transcript_23715/g.41611  ORF Transcript_23715/g.41611 Transcript_23715/m.41611 type:complete len:99 (+) Transcript_23715:383-679(+)
MAPMMILAVGMGQRERLVAGRGAKVGPIEPIRVSRNSCPKPKGKQRKKNDTTEHCRRLVVYVRRRQCERCADKNFDPLAPAGLSPAIGWQLCDGCSCS